MVRYIIKIQIFIRIIFSKFCTVSELCRVKILGSCEEELNEWMVLKMTQVLKGVIIQTTNNNSNENKPKGDINEMSDNEDKLNIIYTCLIYFILPSFNVILVLSTF